MRVYWPQFFEIIHLFFIYLIRLNDAKQKIKSIYTPCIPFVWHSQLKKGRRRRRRWRFICLLAFTLCLLFKLVKLIRQPYRCNHIIYWNCHNINNRQHDAKWFWNYTQAPEPSTKQGEWGEREREGARKCQHKRTNGKSNAMWYALLNLIPFCACVESFGTIVIFSLLLFYMFYVDEESYSRTRSHTIWSVIFQI